MYHWRTLKIFLSNDPVLWILKHKMIGTIQGPISAPVIASSTLDGINEIIQLLNEAGFIAGTSDAVELLDYEQDCVIHACQSLYEKLVPLTGICTSEDHAEATAENDHVGTTAAEGQ